LSLHDALPIYEVEGRLIEQYAVLDRRRPGQHGAPRGLRRVRVDDAAPPLRSRLAARGPQLVLGERRPAAFADALRAEDLDHVGARGNALPDGAPQPVGVAVLG